MAMACDHKPSRIVDAKRLQDTSFSYLIEWEQTWLPEKLCTSFDNLIEDFWRCWLPERNLHGNQHHQIERKTAHEPLKESGPGHVSRNDTRTDNDVGCHSAEEPSKSGIIQKIPIEVTASIPSHVVGGDSSESYIVASQVTGVQGNVVKLEISLNSDIVHKLQSVVSDQECGGTKLSSADHNVEASGAAKLAVNCAQTVSCGVDEDCGLKPVNSLPDKTESSKDVCLEISETTSSRQVSESNSYDESNDLCTAEDSPGTPVDLSITTDATSKSDGSSTTPNIISELPTASDQTMVFVERVEKRLSAAKRSKRSVTKKYETAPAGPVHCDLCLKKLSSKNALREHKIHVHFKNGRFACDMCDKRFSHRRGLEHHKISHTNNRDFECPHCNQKFKYARHLHLHVKRNHVASKNFRCDVCFACFKTQGELKSHCFSAHVNCGPIICIVCKHRLLTPWSIYVHSLRHQEARDHICTICKSSFASSKALKDHERRVHADVDKPSFLCEVCGKTFQSRSHFYTHKRTHTMTDSDLLQLKCTICNTQMQHKSSYNRHMLRHQPGGDMEVPKRNPYENVPESQLPDNVCPICRKALRSRTGFTDHLKRCRDGVTTGVRCKYCDRMCAHKSSLKRHILRRHTNNTADDESVVESLLTEVSRPDQSDVPSVDGTHDLQSGTSSVSLKPSAIHNARVISDNTSAHVSYMSNISGSFSSSVTEQHEQLQLPAALPLQTPTPVALNSLLFGRPENIFANLPELSSFLYSRDGAGRSEAIYSSTVGSSRNDRHLPTAAPIDLQKHAAFQSIAEHDRKRK